MYRLAAMLLSALGALFAAPLSAQSLTLVSLPVVYVSSPVVQQTHQGHAIAPSVAAPRPAVTASAQQQLAAVAAAGGWGRVSPKEPLHGRRIGAPRRSLF